MADAYVLDVDSHDDYRLLKKLREVLEAPNYQNGNGLESERCHALPNNKTQQTGSCGAGIAHTKLLNFETCFSDRRVKSPAALCVSANRNLQVYDTTSNAILVYDAAYGTLIQQVRACDCTFNELAHSENSHGYRLLSNHINDDFLAVMPCCGTIHVFDKYAQTKLRIKTGGNHDFVRNAAVCIDLHGSVAFSVAKSSSGLEDKSCRLQNFDMRFGNCVSTARVNLNEAIARHVATASNDYDLDILGVCVNAVRQHELLTLATVRRTGAPVLFTIDMRRSDSVRRWISLSDQTHMIGHAADLGFNLNPRGTPRNLCDLLLLHSAEDCGNRMLISTLDAVTFDLRECMQTDRPTLFDNGSNARLSSTVNEMESNVAYICAPGTPFITAWQY